MMQSFEGLRQCILSLRQVSRYKSGDKGIPMPIKAKRRTFRSVYLLQHVAREDTDDEDIKTLGIFSGQGKAELAIKRLVKLPGFNRYPDGFHVDRYRLDQSEWTEGFVTKRSKSKSAVRTPKSK